MHHLKTKIRKRSSKHPFHLSSANDIIVGSSSRRVRTAVGEAASEPVDWEFVGFPPAPSVNSNIVTNSTGAPIPLREAFGYRSSLASQPVPPRSTSYSGSKGDNVASNGTYQNQPIYRQVLPQSQRRNQRKAQAEEEPSPPPVPPRIPNRKRSTTSSKNARSNKNAQNRSGDYYAPEDTSYLEAQQRPTSLYAKPDKSGAKASSRRREGSRKRPRSSGHSPASLDDQIDQKAIVDAILDKIGESEPPPLPPHQGHYALPSYHDRHHPRQAVDDAKPPPIVPRHMHGTGVPIPLPLSPPAPMPPEHGLSALSNRLLLLEQRCVQPDFVCARPSTLLREIDASLSRHCSLDDALSYSLGHNHNRNHVLGPEFACDSPFYRRPSSILNASSASCSLPRPTSPLPPDCLTSPLRPVAPDLPDTPFTSDDDRDFPVDVGHSSSGPPYDKVSSPFDGKKGY